MSPASDNAVPPLHDYCSTIPQTPNSKRASSVISDTPRSIRTEPKKNVPYERQDVCKEMDEEIVTVPHASFLRDYAPWHPSDDAVKVCLDKLVKTKLVTKDRCHFTGFQKAKPNDRFKSEIAAYKFITSICDAIAKADVPHRAPRFKMEQKPRSRTASETPGSSHEIDGYFRPLKSTVPDAVESESKDTPTADSAANCEWKLHSGPEPTVDNYRKAVSAAVHVMNDDVRRMFTYSITIENERMSLWYWSRSHSAKSDWFDFTKDIRTTVRALASFIFAKMDEIGYDPTIQRRLDIDGNKRELCLVFEVQDQEKDKKRYFKTLHSVAEHLSLRVTGRLTRVFKVIEVGSFDDLAPIPCAKPQILKYVWLDAEAKTEREIQNKIFEDLDKFATKVKDWDEGRSQLPAEFTKVSPEEQEMLRTAVCKREDYKRHFLTIDCDQQGFQSKPVSPDAKSIDGIFTRVSPTTVSASLPYADSSRSHMTSATSSQQPEDKGTRQPRDYVPKRQYRVVFNEVCEALQNVRELKTVIRGIQDCLTGLQLMFLAGWVHRDISGGNMLWFSEAEMQGRGILSDLEYAKKFDPNGQGSADPKTDTQGTPFFMPIEIQRQGHIYRPRKAVELEELPSRSTIEQSKSPRMIHNFEHDLESLFWVLLWTITVRAGNESTRRHVARIFQQDSHCSREREEVITAGNELVGELEELVPQELKEFLGTIDVFSYVLMNGYLTREFKLGDLSTYSRLYGFVRKLVSECLGVAERLDIPLLPLGLSRQDTQVKEVHALAPQTRKKDARVYQGRRWKRIPQIPAHREECKVGEWSEERRTRIRWRLHTGTRDMSSTTTAPGHCQCRSRAFAGKIAALRRGYEQLLDAWPAVVSSPRLDSVSPIDIQCSRPVTVKHHDVCTSHAYGCAAGRRIPIPTHFHIHSLPIHPPAATLEPNSPNMFSARLSFLLALALGSALALAAPAPAPVLRTVDYRRALPTRISAPPIHAPQLIAREDVDLNDPEVLKKLGLPRLN
ncbi:hypothetical protein EVG20_g5161 [Dentipellis fragilis]|uniref:Fungal-type protein kinase domain-containing protein n=1 Tax=Dentipellis fragilis TaxID=205917 RepID=A0A4Y9YTP7_9AGAM|nr:hypothetical protein EVG20_g5161 [Dentipellis fragilis]